MHATLFKKFLLLVGDIVMLYSALALTLLVRYGQEAWSVQWDIHLLPLSIIFVLWIGILYITGLYDVQRAKNNVLFFRNFLEALVASTALAIAVFYISPFFSIAPKTNLLITVGFYGLLFTLWRMLYNQVLAPRLLRRRVLFVGRTLEVEELVGVFNRNPQLGYLPVALVELTENAGGPITGIERYTTLKHIRAIVTAHEIDTVVLAIDIHEQRALTQELYELIFWNLDIINIATLYEHITGRVPIASLSESWFLENLHTRHRMYDAFRVSFDTVFALVLLAITAIMTPFLALLIRGSSPGPLFIRQIRIGKNGKRYTIAKFRTMKALAADGSAELDGAATFAQEGDARVTRVGNYLRKFRIDEFPQAWNILKGEMALIGPRPERPEFVEKITDSMPFFTVRHIVRPGLTGWAQINYPYAKSFEEMLVKLQYDLYYIKNRSIMIDVAIFLKTINVMIRRKGL